MAFRTADKIAQIFGGGRPLFERLKGRKPLRYVFLPFVTFAYTHFKMVEARGIEKVEALSVVFAKLRKWLYFAVFYDFAFSSFKWFWAVFGTNKW